MECERYADEALTRMFGADTDFRMDRRHLAVLISTAYQQGRIAGAEQIMPLAPAMLATLRDVERCASLIKRNNTALRIRFEAGRILRWWEGR